MSVLKLFWVAGRLGARVARHGHGVLIADGRLDPGQAAARAAQGAQAGAPARRQRQVLQGVLCKALCSGNCVKASLHALLQ